MFSKFRFLSKTRTHHYKVRWKVERRERQEETNYSLTAVYIHTYSM